MPPKKQSKKKDKEDEEFVIKSDEDEDLIEDYEEDDEEDADYSASEKMPKKQHKRNGKSPAASRAKKSASTSTLAADVPDIEDCNVTNYLYKDNQQLHKFRDDLLQWFAKSKRQLPWRKDFDHDATEQERSQRAYEVWVSEIMLQQTRVDTVMDYFKKWMLKFPTIEHLAKASLEEVVRTCIVFSIELTHVM